MLVLALADPEAKEIARRVSRAHMIQPLVDGWAAQRARAGDGHVRADDGLRHPMDGLYPAPIPDHSLRWLARSSRRRRGRD
jgi:hypothetical protein